MMKPKHASIVIQAVLEAAGWEERKAQDQARNLAGWLPESTEHQHSRDVLVDEVFESMERRSPRRSSRRLAAHVIDAVSMQKPGVFK